jgi:hypothetical protein
MADIYEPAYSDWAGILKANLARRRVTKDARVVGMEEVKRLLNAERIAAIRKGVLTCVHRHMELIEAALEKCRVPGLGSLIGTTGADIPILMAGHQPVIYHQGLLCKVETLSQLAKDTQALGINVVIDTDEGDAGALVWPRISHGQLELRRASISDAIGQSVLYSEQRVAAASVTQGIFAEIERDLRGSGLEAVIKQVCYVGKLYEQLAGEQLVVAHAVVRQALTDVSICEVPLSALLRDAEMRELIDELVSDGERLVLTYNSTLDAYRREHRIHNPANPFPNMKSSAETLELPLWRVIAGRREPVFIEVGSAAARAVPGELVSRGSLTTLILRGFCSDMFIHGLGGGKYDRFVDRLALAYLGVELPTYVVASRTEYLFPEKVSELARSIDLASKLKELTARPEQYFGQGVFSSLEEIELDRLSRERSALRGAMEQAKTPDAKSSVAHALNAANRVIRSFIESGTLREHIVNAASREAALARWSFREFPFFLMDHSYKLPRSA